MSWRAGSRRRSGPRSSATKPTTRPACRDADPTRWPEWAEGWMRTAWPVDGHAVTGRFAETDYKARAGSTHCEHDIVEHSALRRSISGQGYPGIRIRYIMEHSRLGILLRDLARMAQS